MRLRLAEGLTLCSHAKIIQLLAVLVGCQSLKLFFYFLKRKERTKRKEKEESNLKEEEKKTKRERSKEEHNKNNNDDNDGNDENDNKKWIISTVNKLVYREEESIQMMIYAVQFT